MIEKDVMGEINISKCERVTKEIQQIINGMNYVEGFLVMKYLQDAMQELFGKENKK